MGEVVETEILEVKLVESFSLFYHVGVPFVVAFGATFLAHFLLKLRRKKEKQKTKLVKLINLHIDFQAKGLKKILAVTATINKLRANNFKDAKTEKLLVLDNVDAWFQLWHEFLAVFYTFDFSFVKGLRSYIDAASDDIYNFIKSLKEDIELKADNHWTFAIEENTTKVMASTKELMEALKDIDRR